MGQLTDRQQRFLIAGYDLTNGDGKTFEIKDIAARLAVDEREAGDLGFALDKLGFVSMYVSPVAHLTPQGREWVREFKHQEAARKAASLPVDLNQHQREFLLAVDANGGGILYDDLETKTGLSAYDVEQLRQFLKSAGLIYCGPFGLSLSDAGKSTVSKLKAGVPQPERLGTTSNPLVIAEAEKPKPKRRWYAWVWWAVRAVAVWFFTTVFLVALAAVASDSVKTWLEQHNPFANHPTTRP